MSHVEHKLDLIIARDSHAVGSPTTNGSTITAQTVTLAKEINTTLALLLVVPLTIGTYLFLMRYTPTLSNEIILPSKFLEDNIAAVLSLTWPKHYLGSPKEKISDYPYDWVLFYRGFASDFERTMRYQILGFDDIKDQHPTREMRKSHMSIVKAFSPVMKSLVQIAIWNYVSLWLVLVIVFNTLVYNGFLSHDITHDSVLRLVLVGVYAVASIGHRYRTTTLLDRNFTSVLFQACWTIISKDFIFAEYIEYKRHTMEKYGNESLRYRDHLRLSSSELIWTSFRFELFGTMENAETYQNLARGGYEVGPYDRSNFLLQWLFEDKRRGSHLKARKKIKSDYDKFVKPIREAQIEAYEKAADSALERVLANVAVLLAICLATALAPWNSTQTVSATSAQLGSYALLLSISTGFLALAGSMTQLTNASESARILLRLQEKIIGSKRYHHQMADVRSIFSLRDEASFSLSKDVKGLSQLTSCSLWRSMSLFDKLRCLLLGPALMLIPRMHGDRLSHPDHGPNHSDHGPNHSDHGSDYLSFKIQGVQFDCWTTGSRFGHLSRLVPVLQGEETRQERENMDVNAKRERENMDARGHNEDENIIKRHQETPKTSGNFDSSDDYE